MPPKKEKKDASVDRRSRADSTTKSVTSDAGQSGSAKWTLNERILCIYPRGTIYKYDAKILAVDGTGEENVYTIHYQGWNSRHDEFITETEAVERFTKFSDNAAQEAKVCIFLKFQTLFFKF